MGSRFTVGCLAVLLLAPCAGATIIGLNQIVTPDIQPAGLLALSAQAQPSLLGNSQQLQLELGLTPRFEAAWFQGLKPGEGVFSLEANLVEHGSHLLTVSAINWSTRGGEPAPVLEYGYYAGHDHGVAGAIRSNRRTEALLGYKHAFNDRLAFAADYQSGPGNSATIGVTLNFTPALSLNPALYFTNTRPRRVLGYAVLTWSLPVWK